VRGVKGENRKLPGTDQKHLTNKSNIMLQKSPTVIFTGFVLMNINTINSLFRTSFN